MRRVERSSTSCVLSLVLVLSLAAACTPPAQQAAPEAPPPPPPAYQPNFTYKPAAGAEKVDVTVGVIEPVYSTTRALEYHKLYENDRTLNKMLSALNASFAEILVAKGFNTKGPFVSLNDMTFPDKKGSDLLFYPEFDFQVAVETTNKRPAAEAPKPAQQEGGSLFGGLIKVNEAKPATPGAAAPVPMTCDGTVAVSGNIVFIVQEPLSGEKMWVKRLDVSGASQTFPVKDCNAQPGDERPREVEEAWAKAHEIVYQTSMSALDKYINGEEFQQFKRQAQELRDKKAY